MRVLIKVGSEVSFDEIPTSSRLVDGKGVVTSISGDLVTVHVGGWGYVEFDLAGGSWSHCGEFKRDSAFIDWSD